MMPECYPACATVATGPTPGTPLRMPSSHDTPVSTAVILARGLGTRMRAGVDAVTLSESQATQARRGLKGMIPDRHGRPFLAHVLSALADGGIRDVCLVVAPEHTAITEYLAAHPPRRVRVALAVQPEPVGTANAVLAAADWLAGRDTLVLNADNLYPVDAIRALVTLDGPGTIAFDRDALIRESNIDAGRIRAFALLDVDDDGWLRGLVEKPSDAQLAVVRDPSLVSMNLWRIDARTLDACRTVERSVRGEYELPEAIVHALQLGQRFRVRRLAAGVLDLSSPTDIAAVATALGTRACDP
jgi:UDP-N-acetylglucosamine diphosphorylase / glucose-1-phosphate thymidylyltransferase / UDP-N-acetylgalactosamine diphosphorylase / glucosamine-1-phosphate N-acetyltransferase / galactosamine-1-phosphate N-acetyltransferase